jgi:hypothetical protein
MAVAPMTAPVIDPMPPRTIMITTSIERTNVKVAGVSRLPKRCPESPPATPAKAEPRTKASTL